MICPICLEETNECRLDCEHMFCDDCIRRYILDKISEKETSIPCPCNYCDVEISEDIINEKLDNDDDRSILEEYTDYKSTVASGKIYSMCPNCERMCKKNNNNNELYCSWCHISFCYVCNEHHYYYDSCPNESEIIQSLREIKSALDEYDIKMCPVCKVTIHREEGCNAVKCKYCKTRFCWNCLRTNRMIKKTKNHECDGTYQFNRSDDEDQYTDGYDSTESSSDSSSSSSSSDSSY